MATMRFEIYDAFRAAGVPDDKARAAAEAISEEHLATKGDVGQLEKRFDRVDRDILLMKWMLGIVIAAQVIPLVKQILQ